MSSKKLPLSFLMLMFCGSSSLLADEVRFDYPELSVTPRATERLRIEAEQEASKKWTQHLPIQLSALSTFTTGLLMRNHTNLNDDPNKRASTVGLLVGGGWLATTLVLTQIYTPYQNGYDEIKDLPTKTKREELTRERFAEEALYAPARAANRLMLLSLLTQLGASAFMLGNAQEGTIAVPAAAISAILSVTPFFFPYHWKTVASTHQRYKKRIYGPVTQGGLLPEPGTQNLAPGLTLSLHF